MSDPHPPHDDNHGSGHGSGHTPAPQPQPPMVAYLTPAPAWPQAQHGHCGCSGSTPTILQPWPMGGGFMVCCRVCGLVKDEHGKHGHDEHKTEPPPEFSDAVPDEFRHRFKDVWHAVQENRIPAGIIADCHALLLLLLQGLDGQDARSSRKEAPSGCFNFSGASATPVSADLGLLKRIKALREKGRLLASVEKAAGPIRLDPGDLDMAPLGDPERARRYMNLVWQIADQGYEQVRWAERGQSPPRAKAAEPEGHGH
ncbi:hypothetical protein QO010_002247 [Caulobacter ginsengisoli]|uniref:DUF4145 domain-containing protein n=1 Tax=Caulobacter ginsengisoli TaxID=400775 RepID=A0ABU0IR25_9CAUL|nr:hypothetical protein [Caulobacter ginsengisoli]MDQ0464466.1 hypothetical protein [Caulobacter ginsengisoli]